jgi:MFS family permease|tara:strand:+ start:2448 stop:3722 length:1275 start_codon:yes stop_codon:yes gene_type:complete
MTAAKQYNNNSSLAPFYFRSFRFQWSADLGTAWAFEMETIILGWYILDETGSVLLLTIFASLQFLGTLIAPLIGVLGNRIGYRNVLCSLRLVFTLQATIIMILAISNYLSPPYVFAIALIMGVFRPSDLVMRYALIGQTIPAKNLTGAMSINRMTTDSARIAGALAGAGTVAMLGIGSAYLIIVTLYATSLFLSFGISKLNPEHKPSDTERSLHYPTSPWRDLKDVFLYAAKTPHLLAALSIAFLVNLTAFPLTAGLLPYVAKNIYLTNQTGLGYLAASFAFGAMIGSVILTRIGNRVMSGRMIIVFCSLWYVMLFIFSQFSNLQIGIPILIVTGCVQGLGLVPMSAMLVRTSDKRFSGGILGLRMLAVYGLPIGLLIAGPVITFFGYKTMVAIYSIFGLTAIGLIMWRWHIHLWSANSPPNLR